MMEAIKSHADEEKLVIHQNHTNLQLQEQKLIKEVNADAEINELNETLPLRISIGEMCEDAQNSPPKAEENCEDKQLSEYTASSTSYQTIQTISTQSIKNETFDNSYDENFASASIIPASVSVYVDLKRSDNLEESNSNENQLNSFQELPTTDNQSKICVFDKQKQQKCNQNKSPPQRAESPLQSNTCTEIAELEPAAASPIPISSPCPIKENNKVNSPITATQCSPKVNGGHSLNSDAQLENSNTFDSTDSPKAVIEKQIFTSENEESRHDEIGEISDTAADVVEDAKVTQEVALENTDDGNELCRDSLQENIKTSPKSECDEKQLETHEESETKKVCEEADRYSSLESISSSSSFHSTSSHQLIIDQPVEEEKVPPLRLKLKRKISENKTTEEAQPCKKVNNTDSCQLAPTEHIGPETTQNEIPELPIESTSLSNDVTVEPPSKTTEEINLPSVPCKRNSIEMVLPVEPDYTEPQPAPAPPPLTPPPLTTTTTVEQVLLETPQLEPTQQAIQVQPVDDSVGVDKPSVQYYKCTSCGTFHEAWNLFLHLHERHERFLCIYCIKSFPTAEKLALHLEIKHDLEQNHFNSEEAFHKSAVIINGYSLETRFLMCCTCQHIFRESVAFSEHICIEYMKTCELCGQKGRHTNQCKAHPVVKRRNKKKVREKPKPSLQLMPQSAPLQVNAEDTPAQLFPNQPQQPQQSIRPPTPHSEHSNSSSNMVIDESCNTNHTLLNQFNPFKALDETERLEAQANLGNESGFDTNTAETTAAATASIGEQQETSSNVFKLKLRVPKEFQKPVDEAVSTSDSEDCTYEDETKDTTNENLLMSQTISAEIDTTKFNNVNVSESTAGAGASAPDLTDDNTIAEDEDSVDLEGDESNTYLARILQEIEQTKLDIQKTKETRHHTQKSALISKQLEKLLPTKSHSDKHIETVNNEKHWTPTPPASPHLPHLPEQPQTISENAAIPTSVASTVENDPNQNKPNDDELFESNTDDMKISVPEVPGVSEVPETESQTQTPDEPDKENSSDEQLDNQATDTPEKPITDENCSDNEDASPAQTREELQSESVEKSTPTPDDGIELASEDSIAVELLLDAPLDKFETVDLIRECLKAAYPYCLYCNHARRIAVNAESLVLHLLAQHRFSATVNSITAEELLPGTIVAKLKSFLPELTNEYMNSNSYCTIGGGKFTSPLNERVFECFQCRFVTTTHKELYLHNRKMHLRTAILCFMCRCNFYSFSEILCHICPGMQHKVSIFEIKFRCCLCELENIPSPFRLMVHLRKRHFACDICLEDCRDQSKLSSHVWKHKLHHLCYRCGIAYRNKMDITKHLFWKHGTESALCKRCLNKRWPHVYHFCVPPATFVCEVCQMCFSKAMYLTVHKRLHANDFRYPCTEENCVEKFISRKLLLKHAQVHQTTATAITTPTIEDEKETVKKNYANKNDEDADSSNKTNDDDADADATKTTTSKKLDDEPTIKTENEEKDEEMKPNNLTKTQACEIKETNESNETRAVNENAPKVEGTGQDDKSIEKSHKKKKKKRAKESLEDLNLMAPNLSESGSSSESDSESRSTKHEDDVSRAFSPDMEMGNFKDQKPFETDGTENTGKVPEIWKNFLQAQQASGTEVDNLVPQYADYNDDSYPSPKTLHVCISDHDYCRLIRPPPPPKQPKLKNNSLDDGKTDGKNRKNSTKRVSSSRHSNKSSSSSDESSDTSSSSSCSCGSNCSCSGASTSSTSSSSSENSDSSAASRKRLRKRSERSNRHRKSESVSPLKNHNTSEILNVIDTDENAPLQALGHDESQQNASVEQTINMEPTINESDLETAESDTDEEYYDEHPQKLATELLSQKRAQLMARTLLSPSHNFDIVENSRPSTPSLPGDVVYEKRKKKKKRERKSTSNKHMLLPPQFQQNTTNEMLLNSSQHIQQQQQHGQAGNYMLSQAPSQPTNAFVDYGHTPNVGTVITTLEQTVQGAAAHLSTVTSYQQHQHQQHQLQLQQQQQQHFSTNTTYTPRMSEGSSCSDADVSLKRSKRARRPNKFYGYTSDDESIAATALAQPLVIGNRAFKPQPPPQLVWNKEDLPSPAKSILNNKKTPRTTKRNDASDAGDIATPNEHHGHMSRKRKTPGSQQQGTSRKRSNKSSFGREKLPPIPRLKLRPALFGVNNASGNNLIGEQSMTDPDAYDSSDDDDDVSSDGEQSNQQMWRKNAPPSSATAMAAMQTTNSQFLPRYPPQSQAVAAAVAAPTPVVLPHLPPTPQTTVFNHKIPPALLPNPDFATLQYFKANNIRYPIRPPAGARAAREGESVYCYCRCPYDEVSEMIACDGDNCLIEWFHFECVGIMVAPQGKWFCAECRPQYSEELYPTTAAATTNLIGKTREH